MLNKIDKLITRLKRFLSAENILIDKNLITPYLKEQRGNFTSDCMLVLTPTTTEEISKTLQLCNSLSISVVPLSGNTGLVGGGVAKRDQIIISLKKLNKLRELDIINQTITVEAGFKLCDALEICKKHNLTFPLDLPSRDKSLIGGNLATNAGGLNTIKYGQVKNFTLGLEVVLPNGHIVSDLNKLSKRNIGPDYKNLFIGSEGILGIITAATFKIYPAPKQNISILLSTNNTTDLTNIFLEFKEFFSFQISAFEIMNNAATTISLNEFTDSFFPINKLAPWYALINLDYYDNTSNNNIDNVLLVLNKLKKANKIIEFYTECNKKELWKFRDLIPNAQTQWGPSIKYDIAIPISKNTIFINNIIKQINNITPIALPVIFGHIGDQSLHFNFTTKYKSSYKNTELKKLKPKIDNLILNLAMEYKGNFSAEHGIGLLHQDKIKKYYFNNQFYMLKLLKSTLDPNNILNPNKVIKLTG